ncbi:MAG: hypothetical protein MJZ92_00495 [Paludibacteraceae bacterium]|nr:hypothetical protein [Paludibacteraceae bacterium]
MGHTQEKVPETAISLQSLRYFSAISPLYLRYISAISSLFLYKLSANFHYLSATNYVRYT